MADETAGDFPAARRVKAIQKAGYDFDDQHGSHIILRRAEPPHRRLSVPNQKELARGTLRALIREAGFTVEEFVRLSVKNVGEPG